MKEPSHALGELLSVALPDAPERFPKADSVSYFDTVVIDSAGQKRKIEH